MKFWERWKEWRAWRKRNGLFARIRMARRRAKKERMERAIEAVGRLIEEKKRELAEKEQKE